MNSLYFNIELSVILEHSAEVTDAAALVRRTRPLLLTEPVNCHWFVTDQCGSANHCNLCLWGMMAVLLLAAAMLLLLFLKHGTILFPTTATTTSTDLSRRFSRNIVLLRPRQNGTLKHFSSNVCDIRCHMTTSLQAKEEEQEKEEFLLFQAPLQFFSVCGGGGSSLQH